MDLTEWHSGYRAYRVSTRCPTCPLDANSDGFDFDTEIILQLHTAGPASSRSRSRPTTATRSATSTASRYARDIMVHTVRYRLGARGFGEGTLGWMEGSYDFKLSEDSSHGRILSMMENRPPCRVLDVGCGPGWLASELRRARPPRGRRRPGRAPRRATGAPTSSCQADLDAGPPRGGRLGGYDVDPRRRRARARARPRAALREMTDCLGDNGVVLASVPNISPLVLARSDRSSALFNYDQRGILDRTHLRFFTRRSFLQLARRCRLQPNVTPSLGPAVRRGAARQAGHPRSLGPAPRRLPRAHLADAVRLPVRVRVLRPTGVSPRQPRLRPSNRVDGDAQPPAAASSRSQTSIGGGGTTSIVTPMAATCSVSGAIGVKTTGSQRQSTS